MLGGLTSYRRNTRFVSKYYIDPSYSLKHKTQSREMIYISPKSTITPSNFASILGLDECMSVDTLCANLQQGYWTKETNYDNHDAIEHYQRLMNVKVINANVITVDRIVAKADGLIGKDGGVYIVHDYSGKRTVPTYRLPQIVGYMFLYDRQWWDYMSCVLDDDHNLIECYIKRIYRSDNVELWEKWWKTIKSFCVCQWRKKGGI